MFSSRLPPQIEPNLISRAARRLRDAGTAVVDLTESNPTRAGFTYPANLLDGLSDRHAFDYAPEPFGHPMARAAVAADYARRGTRVDPAHVVLSASTSEAYSWIFKVLCDPGDGVLVPQPSYPLFEQLTSLEAARSIPYRLTYHGRWEIDLDSIALAPAGVRALLLVSPNNPTGSYVSTQEAARLRSICRERGWAIVADEVFADYALDGAPHATEVAQGPDVLSFTLGGASKSLGLPQVKLAWTVVDGPADVRDQALARLELVADAFLSVGTPVQLAAPALLDRGETIRRQIRDRLSRNLAAARELVGTQPSCSLLDVEGGWSVVIRVPAVATEEAIVLDLLDRARILVHPGYFFDFPSEAFLVVSLLPPADVFADAFTRMLAVVSRSPSGHRTIDRKA
jgi:hypothetical protein